MAIKLTFCHADLNQRDCTLDNVSHENTTPGTMMIKFSPRAHDVITCSYNCYISGHTIYSRANLALFPGPFSHMEIEEMSLGTRLGTILVVSICMSGTMGSIEPPWQYCTSSTVTTELNQVVKDAKISRFTTFYTPIFPMGSLSWKTLVT